jgi:bacterioferritin-associated ferredoxin
MLICHCRVVTDRVIRAAIASGARTPAEVARFCRAGTGCNGCRYAVRELLSEHAAMEACGPGASRAAG